VNIVGQAPLSAIIHDPEVLRCNACSQYVAGSLPEKARGPKYTASAVATIAGFRYHLGTPHNRLAKLQSAIGVPVPASTQWEEVEKASAVLVPVFLELAKLAANSPILLADDTFIKILEHQGKCRATKQAAGTLDRPDRTGVFTTAITAMFDANTVVLFASGRQHAGENLDALLTERDPALPPPMLMCDGLLHNKPARHAAELSNCLAHGRRQFIDDVENHPDHCKKIFDYVGAVFMNEAFVKKMNLTSAERLRFHQTHSARFMAALFDFLRELKNGKLVEPNSDIGRAVEYML
jgi:hypothetical protein